MNDSEYRRMKDRADELSLEYGLRTIGWREAVRKKRGEEILPNLPVKYCFAEQGMHGQGKVSWKDELRRTIEAARAQSGSLDEFREYLADSDVTLTRCTEKGIVYKYKDYPPVRGDTLGGDYDDPKTALLNGDIDVATTANYKQAKSLENEPNMAVLEGQSLWVCRLFFNFDDPGLATKEVRQAFAYAIDRNELLQKAFKGAGLPGTAGFVHPDSNWYNPNIPTYDKDVDKAKQLLADAGAVDSNGDGVLEFQGKPMSYELMISANDEAMGEMLKSYLAAVGIELSVKAVDDNTVKQTYQEGNFQLIANGHGSFGGDPKYMAMLATNTAGAAKITVQGGNRWKSEEYDTTFAASLKELDQAKREALVDKLQEIVAEDVPTLPLYYKSNAAAFNKSVFDGFYYTKDGISSGIPYLYNKIILATGTWNKD